MGRGKLAALTAALALALCGCGQLLQTQYYSITPHQEADAAVDDSEVVLVENFAQLQNAVLSFVENGVENGVIRIYSYASGDVEEDVTKAMYRVSKGNPLGAYAVDYMTHECNLIVSYYEVQVHTTFRRSLEEIRSVRQVGSKEELKEVLASAMGRYKERTAVRTTYFDQYDPETLVREYCERNPAIAVECPEVSVNLYPETGTSKIMEIVFHYQNTPEQLQEKKTAILSNVSAAAQYAGYAGSQREKMQLIYAYLRGRFAYAPGESVNPVYSALCEGIASEEGFAKALWLICGQSEIQAQVLKEEVQDTVHYSNVLTLDGEDYAVNIARDILEGSGLRLVSLTPAQEPEAETEQAPEETEEGQEDGPETLEPAEEEPQQPGEEPEEKPQEPLDN